MFVNKKFEIKVLSCEFSWIILLLTYKNQSIIVCTVYIKPSLDFKIATDLLQEALRDATDMYPSALVVLLGDFNSRIANMGDIEPAIVENTCLSYRRPSLDTIRNARCNNFLEFIYANNLFVINGRTTALALLWCVSWFLVDYGTVVIAVMVLGYIAKHDPLNLRLCVFVSLVIALLHTVTGFNLSDAYIILTVILSIIVYILMVTRDFTQKTTINLKWISRHTIGIYCIHLAIIQFIFVYIYTAGLKNWWLLG